MNNSGWQLGNDDLSTGLSGRLRHGRAMQALPREIAVSDFHANHQESEQRCDSS